MVRRGGRRLGCSGAPHPAGRRGSCRRLRSGNLCARTVRGGSRRARPRRRGPARPGGWPPGWRRCRSPRGVAAGRMQGEEGVRVGAHGWGSLHSWGTLVRVRCEGLVKPFVRLWVSVLAPGGSRGGGRVACGGFVFGDVGQWVLDVIGALGYLGLALLLIAENLFPPIPSEVVLPLAGFLVGRGELNLWGALTAATFGSVAGAVVLYGLGRWGDDGSSCATGSGCGSTKRGYGGRKAGSGATGTGSCWSPASFPWRGASSPCPPAPRRCRCRGSWS